jgi:arginine decarboxylase
MKKKGKWNIADSAQLYNIQGWGEGLFGINTQGELTVSPQPNSSINLYAITQELIHQGISLPIQLRFPELLQERLTNLCQAFTRARKKEKYSGSYTPIYPIKVNQQRNTVETLAATGLIGLEAGSKAELMAILTLSLPENTLIVCNGYKDSQYIRLALIAQKIGLRPYLVIEKIDEVQKITQEATELAIRPHLGIRIRLASIGQGKWQDCGGGKAKFGLNSNQLLYAINLLKKAHLINALQMMHFHVGSQLPNIHDIQKILTEAARFYIELQGLNVPVKIIDVGGGLGVDYEGSLSSRSFSRNYTIEEYADNITFILRDICKKHNLAHPDIITETGRALTAYHAVLITDIINTEPLLFPYQPIIKKEKKQPDIIKELQNQLEHITTHSALEAYHNATYWLHEAHIMFSYGIITLEQRAHAEQLIYSIYLKVRNILETKDHSVAHYEALNDLKDQLVDRYFVNFSLFSSAPDAWAIQQLFPIMPLHRLQEYPDRQVTLHDLTCDSDGRFNNYVHSHGFETHLPLHTPVKNKPYFIGIFLIGAYQKTLSNLHNLFGKVHSVDVYTKGTGDYTLSQLTIGDSIKDIIEYFDYDTSTLKRLFKDCPSEQRDYIQELETTIKEYSYLTRKQANV